MEQIEEPLEGTEVEPPDDITEQPEEKPVSKRKIRSEKQLAVLAEARKKAVEKIKENKAKRDYEKLQGLKETLNINDNDNERKQEIIEGIKRNGELIDKIEVPNPLDEYAIGKIVADKIEQYTIKETPKVKKYRVENGHYVLN